MTETEFIPTEQSRALLDQLREPLAEHAAKWLFDVMETEEPNEDAPRRAASIIANSYLRIAANLAVLGCQWVGKEPSLDLWLACAKKHYEDAIKDINAPSDEGTRP